MLSFVLRVLSLIWPIRVRRFNSTHYQLDVTWEYGSLVVNSPNANQSFGSLHRVWRQCLRDLDLKKSQPKEVLILGFGAGSAAHILQKEFRLKCGITGVDHDPVMLRIAREYFGWSTCADLVLHEADAFQWVREQTRLFDLIAVDLFHDLDFSEGLLNLDFLRNLKRIAAPGSTILINTVAYDPRSAARSARLGQQMRLVHNTVKETHYEGNNRVFIAL
ncbi:MAG: methyltransferase domain-containing protein [Flavobacteriales bacterium]|nr:methyltransferase domain-containing protein [Flavobacteriales bacterium]